MFIKPTLRGGDDGWTNANIKHGECVQEFGIVNIKNHNYVRSKSIIFSSKVLKVGQKVKVMISILGSFNHCAKSISCRNIKFSLLSSKAAGHQTPF